MAPPDPVNKSLRTPRRRLILDRAARWVVSAGGLAIIVAILGILFFILAEVWPLLATPDVKVARRLDVPGARLGAVVSDEHRAQAVALAEDGRVLVVRAGDGKILATTDALAGALTPGPSPGSPLPVPGRGEKSDTARPVLSAMAVQPDSRLLTAATSDGRILIVPVSFSTSFSEQGSRDTAAAVGPAVLLPVDPQGKPVRHFAAQLDDDGNATAVAELVDGTLAVVRRASEANAITGEKSESVTRHETKLPGPITALLLDKAQTSLFAGTPDGELLWWPLQDGEPGAIATASAGTSPVTALTNLIGGKSLVVGQENGSLSVWLKVRQPDDSFRLTRVRDFPRHPGAIRLLAPSPRDKGFFALDAGGSAGPSRLGLYYSTSHRTLWEGATPLPGATSLFYTPKADGAFLTADGRIASLDVFNPHPEVSWRT
ncbi:MAG TPA: hypothetical protein VH988_28615, partial [Thermoanaerobaculia bacterium]|nr:hypothetical protein [Thermoanaerobaculia bacterium]